MNWRQTFFILGLLTLICSVLLPLFVQGPMAWLAGFCYITYDTILLFFVAYQVKKYVDRKNLVSPNLQLPTLTVVIAARNEKAILKKCIDHLLKQTQPAEQILFIDDGSSDGSFSYLEKELKLKSKKQLWQSEIYPQFFVLPKGYSGKANSLNQALEFVSCDLTLTLDADTFMNAEALFEIKKAFAENSNLQIAGGVLEPENQRSQGAWLQTFQKFEYIRSFLSRQAWANMDGLILVSGAFAAYKTTTLRKVNGFDPHSFVEDYELTHRIYKYCFDHQIPIHVGVIAQAFAMTDCPDTLNKFLKQRQRWFGGFLQTIYKYKNMVGAKVYGTVGTWMLPIKSIDTLQPLFGLASLYALATIFILGHQIHPYVVIALAAKIILDFIYHYYCFYLYNRWQKTRLPKLFWWLSPLVTLAEPLLFQPLKHLGAFLGWVVFIQNKNEWTAQRDFD